MQTFREFHEAYISENPREFSGTLFRDLHTRIRRFGDLLDMPYDQITDEMLDSCIDCVKSDYAKTEMAFLVHEMDWMSGLTHSLKYDRQNSEPGGEA